jgi:X-X-X-Leu-X-X-Gly heptad repeat protein
MGSRHRPIPHWELVDALIDGAEDQGWTVEGSDLGIASHGATLFGTIQMRRSSDDGVWGPPTARAWRETGTTLGFRSSTNETLALEGVAGEHVFVCSNLCLSGDVVTFKRKSTTGLSLTRMVADGLERFAAQSAQLQTGITRLKDTPLSDTNAKARIFDIFNRGVLPSRLLQPIARQYFDPAASAPDCQARNLWSLNNACTRSIQALSAGAAFDAAHRIGHHFKLGAN